MSKYHVVTFGETMLRLSPKNNKTLEQADEFEVLCAGSESNVAVALSRLGLRSCWFSRLVNNPVGRRITNMIRAHGVDVSQVRWTDEGRNGVAFMELGAPPRSTEVVYDRAGSAASRLDPESVDWSVLKKAKHLHVTGITVALSPSCAECVTTAIARAKEDRLTISFDVNYRQKLWPPGRASEVLEPLMKEADVLFMTSDDAEDLFAIKGSAEKMVEAAAARFGTKWTVLTLGGEGAIVRAEGKTLKEAGHTVQEIDRIGAGDAFVGGFLYGYFKDDPDKALKYGLAMSALKMTTPGDLSFATLSQVLALAAGDNKSVKR
ncbi:MAG: sugar kinase [Planctomycetota bacterium]|nr:sugar kinase [Planctomycetota bacterium]MDA1142738.1 sugar kinase [Planctomycetota bacterium]